LRTFGGEHKKAGSAGNYATEKKEADALTTNSVLDDQCELCMSELILLLRRYIDLQESR
jgi:hypothetical protein